MIKLLLALLLAANFCNAQKLVIDQIDTATGLLVRETEWIKITGTDKSKLKMKIKRIGDDIRFYYLFVNRNKDRRHSGDDYINVLFENDDSLYLEMHHEFGFVQLPANYVHIEKITDQPEALPSPPMSEEQLTKLKKQKVLKFSIRLFNEKCDIEFPEKYRETLSIYAKLL